jgi:chaperonin GroEL (HSP60 family)
MEYSKEFTNKIRFSIEAYAESILIFPKMLSKSCEISFDPSKYKKKNGLNLENFKFENMVENGVIDLLNSKISILNLATDTSNLIIKIDQNIFCDKFN